MQYQIVMSDERKSQSDICVATEPAGNPRKQACHLLSKECDACRRSYQQRRDNLRQQTCGVGVDVRIGRKGNKNDNSGTGTRRLR